VPRIAIGHPRAYQPFIALPAFTDSEINREIERFRTTWRMMLYHADDANRPQAPQEDYPRFVGRRNRGVWGTQTDQLYVQLLLTDLERAVSGALTGEARRKALAALGALRGRTQSIAEDTWAYSLIPASDRAGRLAALDRLEEDKVAFFLALQKVKMDARRRDP